MVGDAGAACKGRSRLGDDGQRDQRDFGRNPAGVSEIDVAPELRPYLGYFDPAELHAANLRARNIGVGVDEVLVASGALDDQGATQMLARDLGVPVAAPTVAELPRDPAMAEAVLRTGTVVIGNERGRPRLVMAARGRIVRRLRRALRGDKDLAARVALIAPSELARRIDKACGAKLAVAAAGRLLHADPLKSAATLRPGRIVGLGAASVGLPLALLLALAPTAGILAVQAALSLVFLAWIALRLAGCLYRPPDEPTPQLDDRTLPVYSLLVPLYREAASVAGLVAALQALDYPALCSKLT